MIDFATTVLKGRVLEPLNSDEYKKVNSLFARNNVNTNSDFPDVARRMVSTSPAACVGIAFAVGGLFGWLTSRN